MNELRFGAGVDPMTGTAAEQTDYGYDALGHRNLVLEGTDGVDADQTLSGAEMAVFVALPIPGDFLDEEQRQPLDALGP